MDSSRSVPSQEPLQSETGQHRCVGCNAVSPPTETNYTLISSRHGWRLDRSVDDNGQKTLRWYCPTCWQRQRKHKGLATSRPPR
jgi:hypothetical protein